MPDLAPASWFVRGWPLVHLLGHGAERSWPASVSKVGGVGVRNLCDAFCAPTVFCVKSAARETKRVRVRESNLVCVEFGRGLGGGLRILLENAHMSGRHGVQCVTRCVASAALTLAARQ